MTVLPEETANCAQEVLQALTGRGWMLTTAESCTGGLVAAAITEIAGSSQILGFGFVTYSNQAKMALLNVPADCLERFGAVSEETARAMAHGALTRSGADVAISITGIAGPDGAVPGKPVGTVCFGVSLSDGETKTYRKLFSGDRAAIRVAAAGFALTLILDTVRA